MRSRIRLFGGALLVIGATAAVGFTSRGSESSEVNRLGFQLISLLHTFHWTRAQWSVLVVSLDRGDTIFALEPDAERAPASNMKLLTTTAALRELGPEFRFRTFLASAGEIQNGVLVGDLVLYGTGDPGLSGRFYPDKTSIFEKFADSLQAHGIHAVQGDLVGDASFLAGPLRPPGWEVEDLNEHFAPGISALSFNENVVSLRIEASESLGGRPIVHTLPDHAGLDIINAASTVDGPARLLIDREDPMNPILVEGDIQRRGRDVWRQLTVSDPPRFTLSVFRSVLEERGIMVRGADRVVTDPGHSVIAAGRVFAPARADHRGVRILATHVSPPLRDYLAVVNKESNNFFAELLFRTLGRVATGTGSPAAGSRAVARNLVALGVDTTGVVQLDGSGLSSANRVRASTLVNVLTRLASTDLWPEFWQTLPEAGNRRELSRMYMTPAAGNLRAKTGTIEGVSALSGVVRSRDGERLAFSILVNGTPSTSAAKRIENGIGAHLASFTRGVDAISTTAAQLQPSLR